MGPLRPGVMEFTLESNPPDWRRIPSKEDVLGVTAVILSVSYLKQEFFRVGFYINNYYDDKELQENEPEQLLI
jgi:histone chaperone ASF1